MLVSDTPSLTCSSHITALLGLHHPRSGRKGRRNEKELTHVCTEKAFRFRLTEVTYSIRIWQRILINLASFSFLFFFLPPRLFRASPSAYGSSQARGANHIYSCQPTPEPEPRRIRTTSATYTTAHGNTRSLTH